MSLATGGFAFGATSTKSRFASLAKFRATEVAMTPTCSLFGPIRRTWETRISSLMRGSALMMNSNPCCRWDASSSKAICHNHDTSVTGIKTLASQLSMQEDHRHTPIIQLPEITRNVLNPKLQKASRWGRTHFLDLSSQVLVYPTGGQQQT